MLLEMGFTGELELLVETVWVENCCSWVLSVTMPLFTAPLRTPTVATDESTGDWQVSGKNHGVGAFCALAYSHCPGLD